MDVRETEVWVLTQELGLQDICLQGLVCNDVVKNMPANAPNIIVNLRFRYHWPEEADQVSIDGFERHAELVAVLCHELSP